MSLEFMKPDVWDGLVLGVTLVGAAMAILRLMNDYARYQRKQRLKHAHREQPDTED